MDCAKTCLVGCGWLLLVVGAACPDERPVARPQPRALAPPGGPVLAQVGEEKLHLGDLESLAALAKELRTAEGLEIPEADSLEGKLDLALEIVALADQAAGLEMESGVFEDKSKRLLARVYLSRFIQSLGQQLVDELTLKQAHDQQIERYLATGESELYRPTLVDAKAIAIGYFPDLRPPENGDEVVMDEAQVRTLALRFHEACVRPDSRGRPSCRDLDGFEALGREFMRGRPTVRILDMQNNILDPGISRTEESLRKALASLTGVGEISEPVQTNTGFYILRRGPTRPGTGEDLQEIRDALHDLVSRKRLRTAFKDQTGYLRKNHHVQTWPRRLSPHSPSGSQPQP